MTARRPRERGSALAAVLVVAALLLLAVLSLAAVLDGLFQRAARRGGECRALAIAEAGAEKGMAEIKRSPSYHGETLRLQTGSSEVGVEHLQGGLIGITSSCDYKGYRRSVRIKGWRDPAGGRFLILEWDAGR